MSFTLIDLGSENFEFTASVWQWKAAVEVIRDLDIVGEGTLRQMTYNATGARIALEDAHELGRLLAEKTLQRVPPGHRIFADLSVTSEPDDKTLHRDNDEQWKNYSVTHEWLKEFSEFCLNSKGFQVF